MNAGAVTTLVQAKRALARGSLYALANGALPVGGGGVFHHDYLWTRLGGKERERTGIIGRFRSSMLLTKLGKPLQ